MRRLSDARYNSESSGTSFNSNGIDLKELQAKTRNWRLSKSLQIFLARWRDAPRSIISSWTSTLKNSFMGRWQHSFSSWTKLESIRPHWDHNQNFLKVLRAPGGSFWVEELYNMSTAEKHRLPLRPRRRWDLASAPTFYVTFVVVTYFHAFIGENECWSGHLHSNKYTIVNTERSIAQKFLTLNACQRVILRLHVSVSNSTFSARW